MNDHPPHGDPTFERSGHLEDFRMWLRFALALFLVLGGAGNVACSERPFAGEPLKITIGTVPSVVSAPFYVAVDNGYFAEAGLDVEIKHFGSGREAVQAMREGEVDLAACAGTPIARAALNGEPLAVFCTLDESDAVNYIVGRRDLGVDDAGSLAGKKVGTLFGTSAHYFLETYLLTNGLDPEDVTVVGLESDEIVAAVVEGEVDAMSGFDPYVLELEERLGERAAVLDQPDIYTQTWNLVGPENIADQRPEVIEAALTALLKAVEFLNEKPVTARNLIMDDVSMDPDHVVKRWPDYRWQVTLDQSLVLALEEEARWLARSSPGSGQTPAFLDYIDTRPLSDVRPAAVTIVDTDR